MAWGYFWPLVFFFCLGGVIGTEAESKSFSGLRANGQGGEAKKVAPASCRLSRWRLAIAPAGETPAGQPSRPRRYFVTAAPSKCASISSSVLPLVSGKNHVAVTK